MVAFRSATGEAWQEIMLSCTNEEHVLCDKRSDDYLRWEREKNATGIMKPLPSCGSHVAYPYFISFFMLCSFLVRRVIILDKYKSTVQLQEYCVLCNVPQDQNLEVPV